MRQESKQRRLKMDFSQLHTYTPPLCVPDNTGYTYALSSSYSTAALEFEKEHQIAPVYESPKMSRRSLRLQNSAGQLGNDSMVDYSYSQSTSSSSSSGRKDTRTSRSKKQQSSSRSLSLSQVATPRVALSFSTANTSIRESSEIQETNTALDASLQSSILDQSLLRQRNISTIITTTTSTGHGHREKGISSDNSSGINGSCSAKSSKSHSMAVNGFLCKDCAHHSQRTTTLATQSSSSSSSVSSLCSSHVQEASANALSASSSPFTSIYSRDRSRRSKTGVLRSISNSCLSYSKQTLASVVSLVTLFCSSVLWVGSQAKSSGKGLFSSVSSSMGQVLSSSLSQLRLLKQSVVHRVSGNRADGFEEQAHSSFCGSLNVKDLATEDASHLKLNGSLCDDCKGKQYSETHTVVHTDCSRRKRLTGLLWSVLAFAGYCLLQPGYCVINAAKAWGSVQPGHCVANAAKALGSAVGAVAQKTVSLFWLILAAPVNAGKGLLWFLACGWYRLVALMSLLNVLFLTSLSKIWKLLLLLIPFLLLFALWWWGPSTAALLAYFPAVNLTEWRPASFLTFKSMVIPATDSESVSVSPIAPETPVESTPSTPVSQASSVPPSMAFSSVDLERLEQVERQLALLWGRVEQGDVKQAQQHKDIVALYNSLKQQLHSETDRESLGLWVSTLLEPRLALLQGELHKDSSQRAETAEQHRQQQESQGAQLAELELLLKELASKTEEVQQKQQLLESEKEKEEKQVVDATPVSVGVQQQDHDALLAEVKRLESELGKIRADLQGVIGCKGKCEQLDTLQETLSAQVSSQISSEVSAHVRRELQALFYGSGNKEEVPESLLHWLSQHYTRTSDLKAALAEMELDILRNVSLQLELNKAQIMRQEESHSQTIVQTVTGTVQHAATAEGMTEEHVKVIVQNALKLFSQDRTGLVDYALESGGGSILSTRCSETYETKTALMSLFGLPLWYFSQSPRVVIQPDVYPGNCWAFKGSQGYLVIRLSMRVLPTSFCVEHIPKTLSPTGNITSAPRNFTVFGLDDEYQEEGILLGNYIYQEDGESLQTFPVNEPNDKAFQIIEVRVLSNWGHPEYTCLYRFRVHGEPRPE